jgi:hypothetical protein
MAQQDFMSLLAVASPYSTTNEVERRKINICTLIFWKVEELLLFFYYSIFYLNMLIDMMWYLL